MKLTDRQRSQLKAAAIFGGDHVSKVAAALQLENPEAFWKERELHNRNFWHEPMSYGFTLPHRSFVHKYVPGRKSEYSLEQRQIMAQNHHLTVTRQIGVGE